MNNKYEIVRIERDRSETTVWTGDKASTGFAQMRGFRRLPANMPHEMAAGEGSDSLTYVLRPAALYRCD
jgi:hypothetical protein